MRARPGTPARVTNILCGQRSQPRLVGGLAALEPASPVANRRGRSLPGRGTRRAASPLDDPFLVPVEPLANQKAPSSPSPTGNARGPRLRLAAALLAGAACSVAAAGHLAAQANGAGAPDAGGSPPRPAAEEGPCPTLLSASDEMLRGAEQERGWTELQHLPQHRLERSVGIIRVVAPADIVFAVVTDYDGFERFMPMVRDSIRRGDRNGRSVVHQSIDLPFPISNRYFEIEVESRDQPTRRGWRCLESRWSYVPGSGNIAEGYGRWEVLEDGAGRALVAYVAFVDPGGKLPGWAFSWATRQGLPRILQAVQKEARRRAPAADVR